VAVADGNREGEDLDLLTFEEAGIRLRDEVDLLRRQLHDDDGSLGAQERARLEQRLKLLLQARDRLNPGTGKASPFEKYFGRPAATNRTEAWEEFPAPLASEE
jgi:hypothetical protein